MPLHLRSGIVRETPVKKYKNAKDIFIEEKSKTHTNLTPIEIRTKFSQEWDVLDESQKKTYKEAFEKYDQAFKAELMAFYGHTKRQVTNLRKSMDNIPEKPRKVQPPHLQYSQDFYEQFKKENPKLNNKALQELLSTSYKNLSEMDRKTYEQRFAQQESEYWEKLIEWRKQYGNQFEQNEQLMIDKFKRTKGKNDKFQYMEIGKPTRSRSSRFLQEQEETSKNFKKGQ